MKLVIIQMDKNTKMALCQTPTHSDRAVMVFSCAMFVFVSLVITNSPPLTSHVPRMNNKTHCSVSKYSW